MSYHFYGQYGQADWFYGGKPPADSPEYVDPSGQKLSPVPPAGGVKNPAPRPAPKKTAPTTPSMEDDEIDSRDLLLYAGIGIGVLTLILITIKLIKKGADDDEDVAPAEEAPPKKPKTITVAINLGDEEPATEKSSD